METIGEVGETSFESWAREIYLQCPEIITIWSQSSNAYTRAAAAHKGIDVVEDAASEGFRILVLDGCTDRCATKKLDEAGIRADICMVVTELGIEKTRPSDVKPEYVETIIRAIKEA